MHTLPARWGATVGQQGHYPFGESWYNTSGDKLLFTTYERDGESGNDYAMARSYVNRLGRFSSPDQVAGTPGEPQSWNRYGYALGDPVNRTDPTGHVSQPAGIRVPMYYTAPDTLGCEMYRLRGTSETGYWLEGMLCGGGGSPGGGGGNSRLFGGGTLTGAINRLKSFSTNLKDCLADLKAVGLTPGAIQGDANSVKMVNALTKPGILARMDPKADFSVVDGAPVPTVAFNPNNYWRTSFGDLLGTLVHEYAHLANPGASGTDQALINALGIIGATNTSEISKKFGKDCFPGAKP